MSPVRHRYNTIQPATHDGLDDWRTAAVCTRHDPELWFPHDSDRDGIERAKALCRTCPALETCLADRLKAPGSEDRDGVFAATTPQERARIRTNRARKNRNNTRTA